MKKLLTCLLIGSILLPVSLSRAQDWRYSAQGRAEHYGKNTSTQPYNTYNTNDFSFQPMEMYPNPYLDPYYYYQFQYVPVNPYLLQNPNRYDYGLGKSWPNPCNPYPFR